MIRFKGKYGERCEILADYLIQNKSTVRKTSRRYGVSKSTVHKDITQKLKDVNPSMYDEVKSILDLNKAERHIRGGEATRRKYKKDLKPDEGE